MNERATQRCAEIIPLKLIHSRTLRIEVVARVEIVIADVIEEFAMKTVRSRAGGDIHYRTGAAAVLGTKG